MVAATSFFATEEMSDRWIGAIVKRVTRVRGLYQAIWRAIDLVHEYRAEHVSRRENWRTSERVVACFDQIKSYRASIRMLRRFPVRHGCGAIITQDDWSRLPMAKRWRLEDDDPLMESRLCPNPRCCSHVSIEVEEAEEERGQRPSVADGRARRGRED